MCFREEVINWKLPRGFFYKPLVEILCLCTTFPSAFAFSLAALLSFWRCFCRPAFVLDMLLTVFWQLSIFGHSKGATIPDKSSSWTINISFASNGKLVGWNKPRKLWINKQKLFFLNTILVVHLFNSRIWIDLSNNEESYENTASLFYGGWTFSLFQHSSFLLFQLLLWLFARPAGTRQFL